MIGFFVVFEPSYALGCLALLSSLTRHASGPVTVDILLREEYRSAAERVIAKLERAYGSKLRARMVIVPSEIVAKCSKHKFRAHFIPEILFRLYYFDLVTDHPPYVIHLDLDMLLLGDAYAIRDEFAHPAMLHAVEAPLTHFSQPVMPPHITRYINSGLLAFDASQPADLLQAVHRARAIVDEIAAYSYYVDQDAVNIAFYDAIKYLPERWNFTLSHFKGFPIPNDTVVLHATGSRKPWFFNGGHPFSDWYRQEADLLRLSFSERYDFTWAPRRLLKRAKRILAG